MSLFITFTPQIIICKGMKNNYSKQIRKQLVLLMLVFGFVNVYSQQDLPISLTPQEKLMMHDYYMQPNPKSGVMTPPISKVRNAAEWEEIDALIVTWTTYTSILREIVRNAVNECKVYIVCSDSNTVKTSLTSGGVNLTNVRYVIAPYNSVWVRDYGANNVYTNDVDSLLLVDWTYNRPRPKDDTLARTMTKVTGIPLYEMTATPNKLVATGGNWMTDGMGTAFSSHLITDENSPSSTYGQNLTEADIDTLAKHYLGINKYIFFPTLPYDGIHHIDMHVKLLDEETLLWGQYPTGVADGPQIEANIAYLQSNYTSTFGTPYRIVRMPMPPDSAYNNAWPSNSGSYLTYTNGVFVNKTFLYPTYYKQYDSVAQRIYQENLPGYNVVPINCYQSITASGAIHCITHCIASSDPLLIVHRPIRDTTMNGAVTPSVYLKAYIKHRSGIQSATIHIKNSNAFGFTTYSMNPIAGEPDYWEVTIPMSTFVTGQNNTLNYYIDAASNSGKTQIRPITAPTGFWSFNINYLDGVNELSKVNLGKIFPNPASAITCIPVEVTNKVNATLDVYDMIGKKIKNIYTGSISGKKNFFINAADLAKGVYMVTLKTDNYSQTQKLIVK